MKRTVVALLAAVATACVALPAHVPVTNRPTDALLLEGAWRGGFASEDGLRGGSIAFALGIRNDTARGSALLVPVTFVPASPGASVPTRAETGVAFRVPVHFVSVADGVLTGVVPAFFDADRLELVQMTFVGRLQNWNVIEGTYLVLSNNLRIEERGTWRVVRGE